MAALTASVLPGIPSLWFMVLHGQQNTKRGLARSALPFSSMYVAVSVISRYPEECCLF
jgi:hypothetical protein